MRSSVIFLLDSALQTLNVTSGLIPTTTVLTYLRSLPGRKGTKEGCAEGDCGACTVALGELAADGRLRYTAIDSCLVFLPMLHGKQLITVESLSPVEGPLHPVQQAMVETDGSQCGYCTPGFIMSMFALYKKNTGQPSRAEIDDALTGNLCRCTGYRPIVEAAAKACVHAGRDQFTGGEEEVVRVLRTIPSESIELVTDVQRYRRPASLSEAVSLKHQFPGLLVISGATDVALRVTKNHEVLSDLLDLSGVEELKEIERSPDEVRLGAGAPLTLVLEAVREEFPALYDMLAVFGSRQIRNLATLGGNLGTASPIGDTLPVLIAYGARVVLESINGRREVPVDEFVIGYRKTLRRPDELITSVIIPKPAGSESAVVKSYKISKRKDLDISTVSAGFRLARNGQTVAGIVLAYGGMAERVKRASAAEEFLTGKRWDRATVEQAMDVLEREFTPISDARAGAEFRTVAARNLLLKFWTETV